LPSNGVHDCLSADLGPTLSIIRTPNAGVDVATANTARQLVFPTTSTGSTNTKTIDLMADINVLIIVGLRTGSVNRELAELAADGSADGITLKILDDLTDLPRYSESFKMRGTPSSVGALRTVAEEADAVLIVTTYRGRIPSVVHNAIDWLTRRWDHATLHDKPLAVIGPASGCYSGVWSHEAEGADGISGPRVIESITISTLREAIKKLANEVHAGDASHSGPSARSQSG
jgi:hypothetical protein